MFARAALLLALLAMPASAQFRNDWLEGYDFSTLKKGDWVEYEVTEDGQKSLYKLACVEVDETLAWIETNMLPPEVSREFGGVLVAVDKASGLAQQAWYEHNGEVRGLATRGKWPDERPREEEIQPEKMVATALGRTTLKVGDKTLNCERVEFKATTMKDGKSIPSKATVWVAADLPFSYTAWEASGWLRGWVTVEFKPKRPPTGTLVRLEVEGWVPRMFKKGEKIPAKMSVKLTKFGDDAKGDLYLRR